MQFPVMLITDAGQRDVFYGPRPFFGPHPPRDDGQDPGHVEHQAAVWACWTDDDWATFCPGYRRLPVIDAMPSDPVKIFTRKPVEDWDETGDAVHVTYSEAAKPAEQIAAEQTSAQQALKDHMAAVIDGHLDAMVRPRGYASMERCVGYRSSKNAAWAAEAQAADDWRTDVWETAFTIMAAVLAGTRPVPTEAELIAELPPLIWPT